jgi:hypothetical protein
MTQNDNQDIQGRKFDQVTRDGSSSAGSVGAGGTGDIDKLQGVDPAGGANPRLDEGMQSGGRTDDLLSGGVDAGQEAQGFKGGRRPGSGDKQEGDRGAETGDSNPGNRQAD